MPAGARFGKVDIIHYLADRYFYRRYLEIATTTTGNYYALIDRGRLDDCGRLMYRCPPDFSDGLGIDYRCPDIDIAAGLSAIAAEGRRFDVMLVDPFPSYEASSRDIAAAFSLLEPGGAMVVHDCLSPNEALTSPTFLPGSWCGLTYKAFLDFVLPRDDSRYITVDTDYGCGVASFPSGGRSAMITALSGGSLRRTGRAFSASKRFSRAVTASIDAGPAPPDRLAPER